MQDEWNYALIGKTPLSCTVKVVNSFVVCRLRKIHRNYIELLAEIANCRKSMLKGARFSASLPTLNITCIAKLYGVLAMGCFSPLEIIFP